MKKPLTNKDGEVRELTSKDISDMRSADEILPADLLSSFPKRKPGQRGKQKQATKKLAQEEEARKQEELKREQEEARIKQEKREKERKRIEQEGIDELEKDREKAKQQRRKTQIRTSF